MSGPVFSAFGEIPTLDHSLSQGGGTSAGFIAVIVLVAAGAVGLGVWHVRHALRCERALLVEWLSGLAAVLLFYGAVSLPLLLFGGGADEHGKHHGGDRCPGDEPPRDRTWHLHHWWWAWVLAFAPLYALDVDEKGDLYLVNSLSLEVKMFVEDAAGRPELTHFDR